MASERSTVPTEPGLSGGRTLLRFTRSIRSSPVGDVSCRCGVLRSDLVRHQGKASSWLWPLVTPWHSACGDRVNVRVRKRSPKGRESLPLAVSRRCSIGEGGRPWEGDPPKSDRRGGHRAGNSRGRSEEFAVRCPQVEPANSGPARLGCTKLPRREREFPRVASPEAGLAHAGGRRRESARSRTPRRVPRKSSNC